MGRGSGSGGRATSRGGASVAAAPKDPYPEMTGGQLMDALDAANRGANKARGKLWDLWSRTSDWDPEDAMRMHGKRQATLLKQYNKQADLARALAAGSRSKGLRLGADIMPLKTSLGNIGGRLGNVLSERFR